MKKQLLDLIDKNLSSRQIANELNISQTTVRYWLNEYGLRTNRKIGNKKERTKRCVNCDVVGIENKFCSNKCQGEFTWKLTKKKIEEGIAKYNPVTYKRYLVETRGCKCEICSSVEWMGKSIPLILDHIDGDAGNCSLKNLRLICPNCDHQTATFAGRNKGRGTRKYRVDTYRKGKLNRVEGKRIYS